MLKITLLQIDLIFRPYLEWSRSILYSRTKYILFLFARIFKLKVIWQKEPFSFPRNIRQSRSPILVPQRKFYPSCNVPWISREGGTWRIASHWGRAPCRSRKSGAPRGVGATVRRLSPYLLTCTLCLLM